MKKKVVMITGASAGIGQATAYLFGRNGYDLILTARRKAKLEVIKHEIEKECGVRVMTIQMDVRDRLGVEISLKGIEKDFGSIDILVNNAGLASGLRKLNESEIEDWETMIDTNIKGLLYVSRAVIPQMISRKSGHIINIGSIAGKEVYPGGNVYCATKFAVDALTRGMRQDLLNYNIKVTQICPGAVRTEFSLVRFKGDSVRADKVYDGYEPLRAEDIAETIFWVTTLGANVNINDMTVMPLAQANVMLVNRK